MKNSKRFAPAWLMLLAACISSPVIAEIEAENNTEKAVETLVDQDAQPSSDTANSAASSAAAIGAEAEALKAQAEDHISRHAAFLDKELMEIYRRDELEITYYFMDVFFPPLMANCAEEQQKAFNAMYPSWQKRHQQHINSGRSIIQGRFKGEDAAHLEQTLFFTLQQLQMQSEAFKLNLCKEVIRVVTPEGDR